MRLRKRFLQILSGASAFVAGCLGLTGCLNSNDEVMAYYGPAPVPQADVKACCQDRMGLDPASASFKSCMEQYSELGCCADDEVVAYYGPAPMQELKPVADAPTEEEEACCKTAGSDDSSEFQTCVKTYRTNGTCAASNRKAEMVAYYGPPAFFENDKASKENAAEQDEAKKESGGLDADEAACCGSDDGSPSFKDCLDAYRRSGACSDSHDDEIAPIYGMPTDMQ